MAVEEELKEIVLKRLESMPDNIRVSLGSKGDFSKEDLIKEVKKDSQIGKLIIKIQIEYIKATISGSI